MATIIDKCKADLKTIDDKINVLKAEIKPISQKLTNLESQRKEIVAKMEEAGKIPRVSDHAVIRYLERVYNFDFEKQREELMTPSVLEAIRMGAKSVKRDGYTLKIVGSTVVTIVE